MCQLGCGRPPGSLFDLQIAAGLVGLGYPMGHGPLVHQLLTVQLAKGETLTDWARRPLTRHQLQYAYDDVRFLLPLWRQLTKRLDRLGRTEWASEEFAALTRRALLENPAVERWRKLAANEMLASRWSVSQLSRRAQACAGSFARFKSKRACSCFPSGNWNVQSSV